MIQNFTSLKKIIGNKPILVCGKGPTFSRYKGIKLEDFFTIGLNRVTDIITVDCSHCIDIDTNLCENFVAKASHVLIPFHPHVKCKAIKETLEVYPSMYITAASKCNKLFTYNLSTWKKDFPIRFGSVIGAKLFSAEAVFNILGELGVQVIHSLGIDGGNGYAEEFKHHKPLKNGRKNFDGHIEELKTICTSRGIIWRRL